MRETFTAFLVNSPLPVHTCSARSGPVFAKGSRMRTTRIMAALVLSLSCPLGAIACTQSMDTSPETPQSAAVETIDDGTIAAEESALCEVDQTADGPLNPRGRCIAGCWALLLIDNARCRALPDHLRRACWAQANENHALCVRDCLRDYPPD